MAKLTGTAVTRRLPIGDRFMQTVRATSGGGASAADEWVDFKEFGLVQIDALVGAPVVIGTAPLGDSASTPTAPTRATATVTFNATDPSDEDTITVNGRVYTIQGGTITADAYDVDLDATEATMAANFATAINDDGVPGTQYSAGVSPHPDVYAEVAGAVVTLTSRVAGTQGNALTLAASDDGVSVTISGATFSGGTDGDVAVNVGANARKNAQGTGQAEGSTLGVVGVEFSAASVVFEITAIGR